MEGEALSLAVRLHAAAWLTDLCTALQVILAAPPTHEKGLAEYRMCAKALLALRPTLEGERRNEQTLVGAIVALVTLVARYPGIAARMPGAVTAVRTETKAGEQG